MAMNISMVVIGHLTNPFDLEGSFSAHFTTEDFLSNGSSNRALSRDFNLLVDAGSAKSSTIHFLVVRLSDGLRIEGFAECIAGRRNHVSLSGNFSIPERTEPIGRFDSFLHWDGAQGILAANWTVPRKVSSNAQSSRGTPDDMITAEMSSRR
jgi:hypothetical protein